MSAPTDLPGGPAVAHRLSVAASGATEFGVGAVDRLPDLVSAVGHGRAFVVTDRGLAATGIVDRVRRVLDGAGVAHDVFDGVGPNPATSVLDGGATAARAFGTAAVVALGGGSALDAAKGIALLATNPERTGADAGGEWAARAGLPLIAVPTTAGTGAETNGFGVFEDTAARRKVYIGHESVRPRVAVLDPELTVGVPPAVTAATGIDALVHGIESLAARGAGPLSVAYATQAVAVVSRWLPAAHRDGGDLEARAQLMIGAHLAGRALTLSGLGLVHGIGHAITANTGTPHGVALAAVLPEVMEFSLPAAGPAYEQAARAMRVDAPADWARAAIESVRALTETLGVRRPLRALGVTVDALPAIAAAAVADAVTRNSPVLPTEDQVHTLLTDAHES